jgi:hypothetical protein
VVVLDPSPSPLFERNARTLRWVGRHIAVRPEHCTPAGTLDRMLAAANVAACEKVIVASRDVRYAAEAIGQLCDLLETHEVVEPQDYLDPLPWWGTIEAGRILLHRGIELQPDHGATFGFRRGAVRTLRAYGVTHAFAAADVFVRREPATLDEWIEDRPLVAADEFSSPLESAFFFSLAPLFLLLAALGGMQLAGVYAAVISFTAIGLALRGRSGAGAFFPLRACFLAPLCIVERSVSVYWALFRKLRGAEADTARIVLPDHAGGTKVASGE